MVIQCFGCLTRRGARRQQNELFLATPVALFLLVPSEMQEEEKQMVSVLWLYLKNLQTTLPPQQEGWNCKRLGAFKPRQSSSDKRMELEVMAQEGIVWIISTALAILSEEIAEVAALGHQRPVKPFPVWHTVGTEDTGLTSTLAGVKELDRETTFPYIWVILSHSHHPPPSFSHSSLSPLTSPFRPPNFLFSQVSCCLAAHSPTPVRDDKSPLQMSVINIPDSSSF